MGDQVRMGKTEQSPAVLEEIYRRIEGREVPPPPEPAPRKATGNKDVDARSLSEDLMKSFMLLNMEYGSDASMMIYAAELFGLNVINAVDCPLTPAQKVAVRQRAFSYYSESLPQIPLQKPL